MKRFLKYFFGDNPANVVITFVYAILMTVVVLRRKTDGEEMSWIMGGMFSFCYVVDLIGNVVDFWKLKKSNEI